MAQRSAQGHIPLLVSHAIRRPRPAMPATERTALSPLDELQFQKWITNNKIEDVDKPGSFYDYRGYWNEYGDTPIRFGVDHFTDTYKQHGHPTFSVESKYSKGPNDGGRWEGEKFIPPLPTITPMVSHKVYAGLRGKR